MITFAHHYQVAYATTDLDAGIGLLRDHYGIDGFAGVGGTAPVERRVRVAAGEATIVLRAAAARFGDRAVEVFQPVAGEVGIFREGLDGSRLLHLHHIGMRCDDIDAVRIEQARCGRETVMSGEVGDARFLFVDAREELGHYLEFAHVPGASG